MKTVKSYIKEGEAKILARVDEYDGQNLIKTLHYQNNKVVYTKSFTYDQNSNLIKEEDENENGTASLQYKYDKNNALIRREHFFGTELYESVVYDTVENTTIVDTLRDNQLIERFVTVKEDNGDYNEKFFNGENQLVEWHTKKTLNDGSIEHLFYNADDVLIQKTVEKYNEDDHLTSSQSFASNGQLIKSDEYEIVNGRINVQLSFDVSESNQKLRTENEYNANGKLIKQTITDANNGKIVRQYWSKFNQENDLIEEYSNTLGSFDAISGVMQNNQSYHHIYEIEYKQ